MRRVVALLPMKVAIKRVLNAGADGVIVPMKRNKQEAIQAY